MIGSRLNSAISPVTTTSIIFAILIFGPLTVNAQVAQKLQSIKGETKERNVPQRESIMGVKINDHVEALLGGFYAGAGIGVGVEVSTGEKIPMTELYARAILSIPRWYQVGELGANINGKNKTRGNVRFNYLRRRRDNFFGIGPHTNDNLETNFGIERRSYYGELIRTLISKDNNKLDAAIYLGVSNTGSFNGSDDSEPEIEKLYSGNPNTPDPKRWLPGLNENAKLLNYGVYGKWDRRNNDVGLTKGTYLFGRIASFDGLDNGNAFEDFGWVEYEADVRVYIPIKSEKTSVALRGFTDINSPKGNSQIPFYNMEWLGGRSFLRGFQNFRFRGNSILLFSGELRRTVYAKSETRGVDAILLTDGGQIWGDNRSKTDPTIIRNNDFNSSNWKIGAGAGVQFRLDKKTAFRLEVASSNESTRAYFSFARGF